MGISIERLPPERSSTLPVAAAAGGCCSCCCCCFHTLGGLIGAAVAKPPQIKVPDAPVAAIVGTETTPTYSARREYWMSFLIASVLTMMLLGVYLDGGDKLAGMALIYLMVTPAVQLAASIGALFFILSSNRPGRSERLGHLGRITLYSFIGAFIGGILVALLFAR